MIDITKIKYQLIIMTEDSKKYDISECLESLGWEENENELATRITFNACNKKIGNHRISSLAKPGCMVFVYAKSNLKKEEVARGYITDWKPTLSGQTEKFEATCYDELYNLQQSQDNIYYAAGISTKSAIKKIFDAWKIPLGKYDGPDVTHGKLIYKSESLSEALLDILEDAKKKGGEKAIIRAEKGKVNILKQGSNKIVYRFEADNTVLTNLSMSTAELVTRVKIISNGDDDKRSKVEAVINGLTEYGIRQKIYVRNKEDSLSDAKKAAQDIINEKGKVQKEISVQVPDVPCIRKGDLVQLNVGTLKGNYLVKSIQHDADNISMSMELKKVSSLPGTKKPDKEGTKDSYNVGDIVEFKGGTHYISSSSGAKGSNAKAGKAKITNKNTSGAHPWHLIHVDSKSNVYGWVNEGTFE